MYAYLQLSGPDKILIAVLLCSVFIAFVSYHVGFARGRDYALTRLYQKAIDKLDR